MTDRFHPADDRLVALYFGDEEGGSAERRALRQHLHGCEACTWRYTELTAPLERLRRDAAGEADEVFTPARLDAQRASILARIGESAAASRVIPFPAQAASLERVTVRRPLSFWVAAAAAAGLLAGILGGPLLRTGIRYPAIEPAPAGTLVTALSSPGVVSDTPTPVAVDHEEFVMGEIEQAVFGHRITALSALDELTPRVRQEAVLARGIR